MTTEDRLEQLEKRIAALEGKTVEKTDRQKLPVNKIAYEKAFEARERGDRKAMKEYCRYYRMPT